MYYAICFVLLIATAIIQVASAQTEAGGFKYAVNDFNGNEQSHQQNRVGNAVNGQYKVLLPDGRLQTVTYIADEKGYRAKVDYTPASPGEATTAGANLPKPVPLPAAPPAVVGAGNGFVARPLSGVRTPGSPVLLNRADQSSTNSNAGVGTNSRIGLAYGVLPYNAYNAYTHGIGGLYGTNTYTSNPYYGGINSVGAFANGAYGLAGQPGLVGNGGGYGLGGNFYAGAGYGVGAYGSGVAGGGYGATGLGVGPLYGTGTYGNGVSSGGYGTQSFTIPIYGGNGYNPIGVSTQSPFGYSYSYSTPFSQVSAYSNIFPGFGYK